MSAARATPGKRTTRAAASGTPRSMSPAYAPANARVLDDRGPGGRALGAVARPGADRRAKRLRGALPLRSLPVGAGQDRAWLGGRLVHDRRARGAHRDDPPGHHGLARVVP